MLQVQWNCLAFNVDMSVIVGVKLNELTKILMREYFRGRSTF